MIELAPQHKIGLPVASPILLAGGSVGYGESIHRGIDTAQLGGLVVGPITRRSIRGSDGPRLAKTSDGFVLHTGLQNRGVAAVVKKFARLWPRLGCPVIAQIADNTAEDGAFTARRLAAVDGLAGLEVRLAPEATPGDVRSLLRALHRGADMPLWARLPLHNATPLALAASAAGADALVVGSPARGAGFTSDGELVRGELYGPATFATMLAHLCLVVDLALDLPLIACGGIHTSQQVRQALAAGASAVQLDSVVWVEPGAVEKILEIGD